MEGDVLYAGSWRGPGGGVRSGSPGVGYGGAAYPGYGGGANMEGDGAGIYLVGEGGTE